MTIIHLPIVRWVDDDFPGFVECSLTDAGGHAWSIIDKLPIFSSDFSLHKSSEYPQPGVVACEIEAEKFDAEGQRVCLVNIEKPWGIEAVDGTTCFWVFAKDLDKLDTPF